MNSTTHKLRILKRLYNSEDKLTATDFSYVSNANQYFCELEDEDLITSEWGKKGDARVKFRYVAYHQKDAAKVYLDNFGNSDQVGNDEV
jgi:hypothetical protein